MNMRRVHNKGKMIRTNVIIDQQENRDSQKGERTSKLINCFDQFHMTEHTSKGIDDHEFVMRRETFIVLIID